jgi:choline dehydrogenase
MACVQLSEGAAFTRITDPRWSAHGSTEQTQDETSGADAPDAEFIFTTAGFTDHGYGPLPPGGLVGLLVVLLRPKSKGTIRLATDDIFDAPLIDPQYVHSK